jgi:hypothetical protein
MRNRGIVRARFFYLQEEERLEGLTLGGGGDVFLYCEMNEEGFEMRSSHIFWMLFIMEEDIAFVPVDILFLGVVGVVLDTDDITDRIEEFLR